MRRLCAYGVVLVMLFGCSNDPSNDGAAAPTVTVTVTETVVAEVESAATSPSETPIPTEPAEDEVDDGSGAAGTREEPASPGSELDLGDWTVVMSTTTQNANEQIAAENQFNDPPVDGRQFVMATVTATYTGSETGTAWIDLGFRFLGASGNTFGTGTDDYCGSIPGPLTDAGEVFPGASVEGNVCVSVPTDQVAGGLWIAEESFAFDGEPTFVALS